MTSRLELLKLNLGSIICDEDVQLEVLSKSLNGYSGSDITNICRDGAMMGLRKKIKGLSADQIKSIPSQELNSPVTMNDFLTALGKIQPSVSPLDIQKYESWMENFGSV